VTTNAIEMQGTLREDGTLVLDEKPNLPPGRVRVIVQPILDFTQTPIWKLFEQFKAERAARGIAPGSQEEIDTYLASMRDDDERCQLLDRIHEECRLHHEGQQQAEAE
jgi:hypothetical protein